MQIKIDATPQEVAALNDFADALSQLFNKPTT